MYYADNIEAVLPGLKVVVSCNVVVASVVVVAAAVVVGFGGTETQTAE